MLMDGESFEVNILPSAMMDIVRGRYFYDQFEFGLGQRFRDYVVGEIDKLQKNAGVDPMRMNYHYRLANRFHQTIYYRVEGRVVTIWRVLDQRFDPRRVDACLRNPDEQG